MELHQEGRLGVTDTPILPIVQSTGTRCHPSDRKPALSAGGSDSSMDGMTVGIGVICENGKAAIVVADRMATYSDLGIQFDGDITKYAEVSNRSIVVSSGTFSDISYVIKHLRNSPGDPLATIPISQIADRGQSAREALRAEQIEVVYLRRPLGLGMAEFQKAASSVSISQILNNTFDRINQFRLALQLLVVGTDSDGAHLYVIDESARPANFDGPGFAAIGSGFSHATVSLARRSHLKSCKLPQAVYNAYEAKRASELAIGVGRATNMAVLQQDKPTHFLKDRDIEKLVRIYQATKPPALFRSDVAAIERILR